jgi:hypothetical protein
LNKCFLIEANSQPGIVTKTIYSFFQYLFEHEKFQLLLIIFQNSKHVFKNFRKLNFQISDPTNETFSYWTSLIYLISNFKYHTFFKECFSKLEKKFIQNWKKKVYPKLQFFIWTWYGWSLALIISINCSWNAWN